MNNQAVAVIGGDERFVILAKILSDEGLKVYSMVDNSLFDGTLNELISNVKIIILPVPVTNNGIFVNSPLLKDKIQLNSVIELLNPHHVIFAGKINDETYKMMKEKGARIFDYVKREEFSAANAIPTAEGAVKIAMENLNITINSAKCMVLGFGRIGSVLCRILWGMGSVVYAEARKQEDIAKIKGCGYIPVHISNINNYIKYMDVVFNTIPSLIINENILEKMKKDCLIIDLASKPGGVDFEAAEKLGIKTIHALSLPGKTAPRTAAYIIKETVFNILDELEGY